MSPNLMSVLTLLLALKLLADTPQAVCADSRPPPGSPVRLTDWRWLARQPEGERYVVAQLPGQSKLPVCEGGFLLLEAQGPGVLDHLLVADGGATLTLLTDGSKLWSGTLDGAIKAASDAKAKDQESPFFPAPLVFGGGPLRHLIAPVGFRQQLRIVADKATMPHFLSYRTFAPETPVLPAAPEAAGPYAKELRAAAKILQAGATFPELAFPDAQAWQQEFVLGTQSRETVFAAQGSGEIIHLEIHASPALSGSLREVVVELRCDGAQEPAVRLPLPEWVGLPHPWINGRWQSYNGTSAAGLQYPWFVHTPRFQFPEDTFHVNLPIPFAKGLRLDLVNRSENMRFTGSVRVLTAPLSTEHAPQCGRLCAVRAVLPLTVGADPQPLLRVPGAGHLVGLGLFTTGGDRYPPAVRNCSLSLVRDGGPPILGQGLVPLWFMGAYGGSIGNQPIWNHPLYDDKYGGAMRHFVTDPLPFAKEAVFGFTPGTDGHGAPTEATALAFWYQFGTVPFAAPPLPQHAESLPHSTFGTSAAQPGSRPFWEVEAEALIPAARLHGGQLHAAEDTAHDYHPSAGKYLHYVADHAGDYMDCTVPFPRTRYFAIGTGALWGPNRGTFELDVLSPQQAQSPPEFSQGDQFYLGRVLGHVPMRAPVFVGQDLRSLRDPGTEYALPFRNPAPDQTGVVRFICQAKPMESTADLLKLDKLRLDLPPPTARGWQEFEDLAAAEVNGNLAAGQPPQGRFEWSGWGAVLLRSPPGGQAVFRALVLSGQAQVSEVAIQGCLGPQQGTWQARVLQPDASASPALPLTPGKAAREMSEWKIPVPRLSLPGAILLEFTCVGVGQQDGRSPQTPRAELVLDAWAAR